MTLKMSDDSKQAILAQILLIGSSFTVRLFSNNFTPNHGMVPGDLTEANFDGYAPVASLNWGSVSLNGSFEAEATLASATFTQTGTGITNNIYGYWVTDSFGNFLWAERNPSAPVAMDAAGLNYVVIGKYTFTNNPSP